MATTSNPGFVNSLYVPIQDRPVNVDVPNTFVTLQWLKTSIRTPMLDFTPGYKTGRFGIGLWKHECNRSSTSFTVSAYYGPMKISFAPYFGRNQATWALGTARSRIEGQGASQRQDDRRNYFAAAEFEIEYNDGPLSIGILSDSYHEPQSQVPDIRGGALTTGTPPNEDTLRYRVGAAVKYFDGRVFFNAEADWFTRWRSDRGTADSPNLVRQNRDDNAWLHALETGVVTGPSKITVSYARATGDDPSTRHTTEDAADSHQGMSDCVVKDWGYLMYYMYGTGDGWDAAGYGQPSNVHHIGGRVDYAIASNVNTFGLCSYAWRDHPNAYRLGGDYRLGVRSWTNEDIRLSQEGTFRGRAVPDHAREIGWEVDLGVNWKILEDLTWNTTLAFWKPGIWWSYAYPNTAAMYKLGVIPNTNPQLTPAGEAAATTGLGRSVDPLLAVETTLLINF